jgi:NADPH:quinone reductase-like Zn-dependent oxidoreductase
VRELGADRVVHRGDDLSRALGRESHSVVVDLVAGDDWESFLTLLRRGGRYVTAGAIAGPIVQMDVLEQIVTAQRQFLEKRDVGKIVLLPG